MKIWLGVITAYFVQNEYKKHKQFFIKICINLLLHLNIIFLHIYEFRSLVHVEKWSKISKKGTIKSLRIIFHSAWSKRNEKNDKITFWVATPFVWQWAERSVLPNPTNLSASHGKMLKESSGNSERSASRFDPPFIPPVIAFHLSSALTFKTLPSQTNDNYMVSSATHKSQQGQAGERPVIVSFALSKWRYDKELHSKAHNTTHTDIHSQMIS